MDVDGSWALIASARSESEGGWYEVPELVGEALARPPRLTTNFYDRAASMRRSLSAAPRRAPEEPPQP